MEPGSLAVGLLRLGSPFGSSLEAIKRFETWEDFKKDSRTLAARFEADKLRLEKWGQAVGFENGRLSEIHHEALNDSQTVSAVEEIFFVIKDTCQSDGDGFSIDQSPIRRPRRSSTSDSKMKKFKWAMGDKAKRTSQVEQFRVLVQDLYNLIPLDGSFTHSEDMNRSVSDREPWNSEFRSILDRIENGIEVKTRKSVHGWLMGHHGTNDLYEIALRRKLDGTCSWILNRPAFIQWASEHFPSDCAKVLWINGSAGFGKTILCASLTEHISSQLETPVGYFFFSSDFESRGDPYVTIQCWLSQIIASHPAAFEIAHDTWVNNNEKIISRGDLINVLQDITQVVPGCTLILDGLDECISKRDEQYPDDKTITGFVEVLTQAVGQTNTRILVVSRDEPEIRRGLAADFAGTIFYQHILPEDVQSDILSYSRSIVEKKLVKKTESLKETISQKMADHCNDQFLWLKMQEDNLRGWKNQKQLEDTIDQTPIKLKHIYERN
ncbi:hypothetical protein PT974_10742 [Cladobotryum mycophilum]|uniref:NACHT domain-containing protein n=1 Tax=Cladobotryum mycophilum TaxID=491253 RepID=A0ABR0SBM8_9HYPO